MKKIISIITVAILAVPVAANANLKNTNLQSPTIAILDTAIDTSIPSIKNSIVHEVCITEFFGCIGQQSFLEGPGMATLPAASLYSNIFNGFDHGTQMVQVAQKANPNIKIVFVRIIGLSRTGIRQGSTDKTVNNALDWVKANRLKFNIQAVVMPQAIRNVNKPNLPFYMTAAGTDYCPKTPDTNSKIESLKSDGVPVFFPSGNDSDLGRVNWPACISSAITVGATMNNEITSYSNYDPLIMDFYALGNYPDLIINKKKIIGAGTSHASVYAATVWASLRNLNQSLSYSDLYSLYTSKTIPTKNSKISGGKMVTNG